MDNLSLLRLGIWIHFQTVDMKENKGPYVVEVIVEDETDCAMGGALDAIREFD
jgi:glyoxylate carboligase